MLRLSSRLAATAIASLLLVGSASAQSTPAPTTPAAKSDTKMAPTEKKAAAPRTAASLECSKQADAKGLHGKERKKFRSDCKNEAKPKAN